MVISNHSHACLQAHKVYRNKKIYSLKIKENTKRFNVGVKDSTKRDKKRPDPNKGRVPSWQDSI